MQQNLLTISLVFLLIMSCVYSCLSFGLLSNLFSHCVVGLFSTYEFESSMLFVYVAYLFCMYMYQMMYRETCTKKGDLTRNNNSHNVVMSIELNILEPSNLTSHAYSCPYTTRQECVHFQRLELI